MERDRSLQGYQKHNLNNAFLQTAIRNAVQIHVERMECPPSERLQQVNYIISLQYQQYSITLYLSQTIFLYTCPKNL